MLQTSLQAAVGVPPLHPRAHRQRSPVQTAASSQTLTGKRRPLALVVADLEAISLQLSQISSQVAEAQDRTTSSSSSSSEDDEADVRAAHPGLEAAAEGSVAAAMQEGAAESLSPLVAATQPQLQLRQVAVCTGAIGALA